MLVFRLVFSIAFGIVLKYRNILNQGKFKKEAPRYPDQQNKLLKESHRVHIKIFGSATQVKRKWERELRAVFGIQSRDLSS